MVARPTLANWLSLAALGVIWGGTFMLIELALRGHTTLTIAASRTTLGAVALVVLMALMRQTWPKGRAVWAYLIPMGLTSTALPFFLLAWGQQYVPSAFAGLAMSAVPLFVLPLAHFLSDEPLDGRKSAGVLIGFTGALVLIGPGLAGIGDANALGQLACVGAALSYAVSSILTRRCPPVDPIPMSAATLAVGTAVLVPAMLIVDGMPRSGGPLPNLAILFLGLFPTALAALLRVKIIRSAGSVFMTLVNYQVPIWSMIFGAAILGELLPWRFFAALMLIMCGLAVSQSRSLRRMLIR